MSINQLPQDPYMLLSVINTKLRDSYRTFDELCDDMQVDKNMILEKLYAVDYEYDSSCNQFI